MSPLHLKVKVLANEHLTLPEGEYGICERKKVSFTLPNGVQEVAVVSYDTDGEEASIEWDAQGFFHSEDELGSPRTELMRLLSAESPELWQWVADVEVGKEVELSLEELGLPPHIQGEATALWEEE